VLRLRLPLRYAVLLFLFLIPACAQTLTPVWVELAPEGATLARVIIETGARCPDLRADGHALAMQVRQPVPEGFKPACQATIPAGTRSLRWGRKKLKLPRTPDRVMVIGDTGCRVKGTALQPCDDPNLWPFARISAQIARAKPDLIVHVGDYLYREDVCPAMVNGCGGPHGDNWPTWNADFFTPVREALTAAPWLFARGNHEDCERSFRGWFYYLDPRPYPDACESYTESYVAKAGDLRLGVLDSSETKDPPGKKPEQIDIYTGKLNELSNRADWLVDHHPFWAYNSQKKTISVDPQTLGPAWLKAAPQAFSLVLSGHIHLFEFVELETPRLRQVIAGDGGTQLLTGIETAGQGTAAGAIAKTGEVNLSFGWTELVRTRDGWSLTLRSVAGAPQIECRLPASAPSTCEVISQKQRSSVPER